MTRHTTLVVVALLAIAACGDSTDTTTDDSTTITDSTTDNTTATTAATAVTSAQAAFDEQVDAICRDIGNAAYEEVQALYSGGEATPALRADEHRIRARAVDALVDELSLVAPTAALVNHWPGLLEGLSGYAAASRELADSIEAGGGPGPVEHSGLDNFRNARLAGACNDWLDMN